MVSLAVYFSLSVSRVCVCVFVVFIAKCSIVFIDRYQLPNFLNGRAFSISVFIAASPNDRNALAKCFVIVI